MPDKKTLRRLGPWVLGLAVLWAGLTWALPVVIPFLAGLLAAWLAEPLVRLLTERTGLRRTWSSVTVLLLLYGLAGTGLWLGLRRAGYELAALGAQLPEYLQTLSRPMARLQGALDQWAKRAPDALGTALETWVDALFAGGQAALEQLGARLLPLATALVGRLPGLLLGLLTAVLSSFFISLELPELRQFVQRLPGKWAGPVQTVTARVRQALGGWFRAQLKLMAITFAIVTLGLTVLGVDVALVMGLLTALVDALPVFGSGTILLPWAGLCFLQGDTRLGIGLAVVYALAALTRQVLEPRLLGKQMGLSPLVTLFALYVGYRFFGLPGMIGLPVAAMIGRQFLPPQPTRETAAQPSCFPARHGLE